MNKIILCTLLMSFFIGSQAQVVNKQSKNALIDTEFQLLVRKGVLTASDANNYVITDQHVSKQSGIHHVYFQQAINGIEINGTESSIHIIDGKVFKYNNKNILFSNALQVKGSSSPSLTAQQAIQSGPWQYLVIQLPSSQNYLR